MHDRINKIRMDNPNFDKKMVDIFAEKMPKLMLIMIEGEEYNNHIGTKEVAQMAEDYITDDNGNHQKFKWTYDEVIQTARNYVNFQEEEFYEADVYAWCNIRYYDFYPDITDGAKIVKLAIRELKDTDDPKMMASHKPYCWLREHIIREEKE